MADVRYVPSDCTWLLNSVGVQGALVGAASAIRPSGGYATDTRAGAKRAHTRIYTTTRGAYWKEMRGRGAGPLARAVGGRGRG